MARNNRMAKKIYHPTPSRKTLDDETAKIASLRKLRLADDAARHAAGTWGDMSVGEIVHEPTGEVFVISWKGNKSPELAKLRRNRLPELSLDEHQRLQAWLDQHDLPDLKQSIVGWSMSRVEAKRTKQARIAGHKASGNSVINGDPAVA
jgi:hypothetical protein